MGPQWSKTTKGGLLGPFCRSNRLHFGVYRAFSDSLWKGNSRKFALIGFCELRLMRVLRSLLVVGVPSSIKITSST